MERFNPRGNEEPPMYLTEDGRYVDYKVHKELLKKYTVALGEMTILKSEVERLEKIESDYNWTKYPDRMGGCS